VTEKHIMYYQEGEARVRKDGSEYTVWKGRECRDADKKGV